MSGLGWGNLFHPPSGVKGDLSMGIVWCMLIVDIFLYSGITWYIDSVRPGEYGLAKPWYFIFMVSDMKIYYMVKYIYLFKKWQI